MKVAKPSQPETMLGFIERTLLHHKMKELEEIPLFHHSYTLLAEGEGKRSKEICEKSVKRYNYFGNDCTQECPSYLPQDIPLNTTPSIPKIYVNQITESNNTALSTI